jgi:hypothetical protein
MNKIDPRRTLRGTAKNRRTWQVTEKAKYNKKGPKLPNGHNIYIPFKNIILKYIIKYIIIHILKIYSYWP